MQRGKAGSCAGLGEFDMLVWTILGRGQASSVDEADTLHQASKQIWPARHGGGHQGPPALVPMAISEDECV
jgi:hypothetical protein